MALLTGTMVDIYGTDYMFIAYTVGTCISISVLVLWFPSSPEEDQPESENKSLTNGVDVDVERGETKKPSLPHIDITAASGGLAEDASATATRTPGSYSQSGTAGTSGSANQRDRSNKLSAADASLML